MAILSNTLILLATATAHVGVITSFVKDAEYELTFSDASPPWDEEPLQNLSYGAEQGSMFIQNVPQVLLPEFAYRTAVEYSDDEGFAFGVRAQVLIDGPDPNSTFYFQTWCRDDFACETHAVPGSLDGTVGLTVCTDPTCGMPSKQIPEEYTPELYWQTDFIMVVGPELEVTNIYHSDGIFQSSTRMPPRTITTTDYPLQKKFNNVAHLETKDVYYSTLFLVFHSVSVHDYLWVNTTIKNAGSDEMTCETELSLHANKFDVVYDVENSDCKRVINGKPRPLIRFSLNYTVETLSVNVNVDQNVVLGEVSEFIYTREHLAIPGLPGTGPSEWVEDLLDVVTEGNITLNGVFGDFSNKGKFTIKYVFSNESTAEIDFIANRYRNTPCQVITRVSENYDARYAPMLELVDVSSPQCSFKVTWVDQGESNMVGPFERVLPECEGICDNGQWVQEEDELEMCPDF